MNVALAPSPSNGVRYERHGALALIIADNPPVNALSHHVRVGLLSLLKIALEDDAIKSIILTGNDRTFPSGADIREFSKPSLEPTLPDVIAAFEASPKPVIAAIKGAALGGGYELALGCDMRIATRDATIGLPEVTLGLIPGAGGSQRLPRIAGFKAAADLITNGRRLAAHQGLTFGMVDQIADDPVAAAVAIAPTVEKRRLSEIPLAPLDHELAMKTREEVKRRARGQASPSLSLDALEAAYSKSFLDGLSHERSIFQSARQSSESNALRKLFFAEKEASRSPGLEGVILRQIKSAGVIGGGTMGAGIAAALIEADLPVIIVERDEAAVATAIGRVRALWQRQLKSGKLDEKTASDRRLRLSGTTELTRIENVDLVIEAVFEDMAVKCELFQRLGKTLKPEAILATNTSYLDVNRIARASGRPEDVVGLHFFSPANIMKLLEVVCADFTAPDVLATCLALGKRMKKVSVVSGVCDGFIGNRIFSAYRRQCNLMLEEGQTPYDIDRAMEAFGFAMGPFAVSDLAGLDIGYAQNKRLAPTRDPRERFVPLADRLVEMGRLGQKSGSGWYIYSATGERQEDPAVIQMVGDHAAQVAVGKAERSESYIAERCIAAMVNEGLKILDEGIAQRASDIDVVLVNGYGFPRWRGGPMHWADQSDPSTLKKLVEATAETTGFGFVLAQRFS
jgi:3-hydroxyacyl-CoA dehydrogenase